MILRRIAQAIKTQDWFQVIIEILIVMIGIFLGLQVTEWNEDRLDRVEEQSYLVALHEDVVTSIELLDSSFASRNETVADLESFASLKSEDYDTIDRDLLDENFNNAFYQMNLFNYQMNVYENLNSSGRLNLIMDDELRLSLSELASRIDEIINLDDTFRQVQLAMIDPYLIDNFPVNYLATSNRDLDKFPRYSVAEIEDYKSFLLNEKTQNLIFYKHSELNQSLYRLLRIKQSYQHTATLINIRLSELNGKVP